jgi:hypothetical protein
MSFDAAKAQLSKLTPDGRSWIDGDGFLDLVMDGQSLSLGLGVVGDEDDDKVYLLVRVVLYADCFGDTETVDEEMVLETAATALGLPEGLDCQVGIEVYDGSTDDDGALVAVENEGEVEVDAFEVQFSPEKPLDQLDEDMLRTLIEGAPYILPSEE